VGRCAQCGAWGTVEELGGEAAASPQAVAPARQVIGAREATAKEAQELGETEGAPLLTMNRTGYATDGRVIEVGQHVYRPSLYSFHFSLFTS